MGDVIPFKKNTVIEPEKSYLDDYLNKKNILDSYLEFKEETGHDCTFKEWNTSRLEVDMEEHAEREHRREQMKKAVEMAERLYQTIEEKNNVHD